MCKLTIVDKTGTREVIDPDTLSGEIWIDEEYCGQFFMAYGEMALFSKSQQIWCYIPGWSWFGDRMGRG
jgi:hypothetical protein